MEVEGQDPEAEKADYQKLLGRILGVVHTSYQQIPACAADALVHIMAHMRNESSVSRASLAYALNMVKKEEFSNQIMIVLASALLKKQLLQEAGGSTSHETPDHVTNKNREVSELKHSVSSAFLSDVFLISGN